MNAAPSGTFPSTVTVYGGLLLILFQLQTTHAQSQEEEARVERQVRQAFLLTKQEVRTKQIGGADDRREISELESRDLKKAALSVCLLCWEKDLVQEGGEFRLKVGTFSERLDMPPICPDERFSQQPVGGFATGFWVGRNLIVTAGHCILPDTPLSKVRCVFGFQVAADGVRTRFKPSQVYQLKTLFPVRERSSPPAGREFTYPDVADHAVLLLSREVVVPGASPLKLADGDVAMALRDSTKLSMIGHPSGMPLKATEAGLLIQVAPGKPYLRTMLDAFFGNSGSPVFAPNGEVVGIVSEGSRDYADRGRCSVPMRVGDEDAHGYWELVTRTDAGSMREYILEHLGR